jgi:hypothetical protein
MGWSLVMFRVIGLLSEVPVSEAILNSLAGEMLEMINVTDQIHPGIMDLSYSAIQGFCEMASSGLGPATPAPVASQVLDVGVTKTISKTENTYVSTTESYSEEAGKAEKTMAANSQQPTEDGTFMDYM